MVWLRNSQEVWESHGLYTVRNKLGISPWERTPCSFSREEVCHMLPQRWMLG